MSTEPNSGVLVGTWTYRSFLNNPDLSADFNSLEFGRGNIRIDPAPMNQFKGKIFDTGWALELTGSITYGSYPYAHTGALFDVTSGSNGTCGGSYLCTAKPGYDGPTGLGTPNGTGAF